MSPHATADERRAFLLRLQLAIEAQLEKIEKILGPNYKLTLICRNTKEGLDADIVMTLDDWDLAITALQKGKDRR